MMLMPLDNLMQPGAMSLSGRCMCDYTVPACTTACMHGGTWSWRGRNVTARLHHTNYAPFSVRLCGGCAVVGTRTHADASQSGRQVHCHLCLALHMRRTISELVSRCTAVTMATAPFTAPDLMSMFDVSTTRAPTATLLSWWKRRSLAHSQMSRRCMGRPAVLQ